MSSTNNHITPTCAHCGSKLIFVSEKTEKGEGFFPITTVIYKCSDPTCQKDIDKKTVERIKLRKKQEKDKTDRLKNKPRAGSRS